MMRMRTEKIMVLTETLCVCVSGCVGMRVCEGLFLLT